MDIIRGKELATMSSDEFCALRGRFSRCWVDVGCGDGLFVYRAARDTVDALVIGIEPAWRNVSAVASKAQRSIARGGAPNALFVRAAVEALPSELEGAASRITVNYPWGSLLRVVLGLDPALLEGLARMAAPGAELEIVLNLTALECREDGALAGIPTFDDEFVARTMLPAYVAAGFEKVESARSAEPGLVPSSWGGRLTRGSGRDSLVLKFQRLAACPVSSV